MVTVGTITLDAALSWTDDTEIAVTDHPVEDGVDISDHARVKPKILTVEGLVTNLPIGPALSQQIAEAAAQGLPFEPSLNTRTAMDRLEKMQGQVVTITTELRSYVDMLLTKVTVPKTPQTGAALRFTVTAKQIRRVQNQFTTIATQVHRAQPKARKGLQVPAGMSASGTLAPRKSFLKRIVNDGGRAVTSAIPIPGGG